VFPDESRLLISFLRVLASSSHHLLKRTCLVRKTMTRSFNSEYPLAQLITCGHSRKSLLAQIVSQTINSVCSQTRSWIS
jgi:hypothetical protein